MRTEVKNSESDDSVSGDDDLESERSADQPEAIVAYILKLFPGVAGELEQVSDNCINSILRFHNLLDGIGIY